MLPVPLYGLDVSLLPSALLLNLIGRGMLGGISVVSLCTFIRCLDNHRAFIKEYRKSIFQNIPLPGRKQKKIRFLEQESWVRKRPRPTIISLYFSFSHTHTQQKETLYSTLDGVGQEGG